MPLQLIHDYRRFEDTTFLRIADKYLPAHTALHVRRLQSSTATPPRERHIYHVAYWPSDRHNVLHMSRVIYHSINGKHDKSWAPPLVFQVYNGMTTSPIINTFPIHSSKHTYYSYSATVTTRWCSLNDDDGEKEDGLRRITAKYSKYVLHTGGRQAATSPPQPPFSSPNNYSGYHIENNEMGEACSQQEGENMCLQHFCGQTLGTEITWKTQT